MYHRRQTCLRFSSDSNQLTMSSATLLLTAIVNFAVSSKYEVMDDTTQVLELHPTLMRHTEQLTALQSPTNPEVI